MVETVLDFIEGEERRKYAETHGVSSLINYYHGLPWNDKKSEEVYRECNRKGITWEQYYNIKKEKIIY